MFLRLVTGLCLLEIVFGASCDRTFTSFSGTVTLPDYQSSFNYANNLNCQYDIRVSSGNAIRLRWTTFDVKGKMPSCYNDYVEIFIGCNRRSIGRYCSSENSYTTPFDVYSPDNCLRLKFRSDSSGTGLGFRATYSTVSDIFGSCPFSESKYSKSGIINSPRWPRVYTTIGSCYWKIEVGSNKAVKIAFMDFDLDYDFGCDDKVKVKGGNRYDSYDNSSTVKDSMCGFKSPFYFTSTKERIWIRFKSDGSLSNRGFVAGYVTYDLDSPSCDRTFTSSFGTVTSPDDQSSVYYANNLNCQYDIRVSPGSAIRLTWTSFDVKGKMPSCYNDYVEIFIGCNRRSIGRYCSENSYTTPFDVYSPDNCLRLKFRSDSSGTGLGFTASYSTVSYIFGTSSLSSSCPSSESKYSNSGVINSPRWPRVYATRGSCYWKIEVGSSKAVKIAFMDFDLDYDFGCDDKVKVKGGRSYDSYDDSSTVKDSMCGFKSPFYFTSTKDRIWIRFKSDGSGSSRGFVAGYVTYDLDSPSSGSTSTSGAPAVVGGIVAAVIVCICIGSIIFYVFVYRKRVAMRQAVPNQAMTTQVNVASQQAVVHPPPPTQPGYRPSLPAGYGPPPPIGYVPPPAGGSFQPDVPPPPYSQVVGSPYPQQDKSGPYPSVGAAPYLPGQAGGPPSYPPGQPGGMAPYPPAQPQGAAPYPPETSSGAAPYPTGPPGAAPYPPK